MEFIGKIIVEDENKRLMVFVVIKNGINKLQKDYSVILPNGVFSRNQDYPFGEMLKLVREIGKIKYNDLSKKIMERANKELILLGLEN